MLFRSLLRDFDGEVKIDGKDIGVETKSMISYLPDVNFFGDWMDGEHARDLFKDMYPDFDEQRLFDLFNKLKIDPKQKLKTMSKGMKERFHLAFVMARKAHIYILDEPIGGVDPAARELILNTILDNYNPNSLVILSTHIISEIEQIFDSVLFLKDGALVLNDEVEELRRKNQKSIDELFKEVFKC